MVFTKAQAKALSILEVAKRLGMEMERSSHKEYYWKEHDSFKINTVKNTWNWYSRTGKFGDTISLVQEIKGVSYKEAMTFLETGNFPEATIVEEERKPFRYTLTPYEKPFRKARSYLKQTRGLSDVTIDFFLEKGVLAEASYRDRDGYVEDVLVFKFLDRNHHIVGASLQGLSSFPDRHEGKGYLKKIMYQSEGVAGLSVAIGSPKRLIVAEAPIDLMSYYELHKDELEDVRLVAMDGLKEGTLSRYAMEVLQERGDAKEVTLDYTQSKDLIRASNFLSETARLTKVFHDNAHQDFLTLAVDNDKAGQDFIDQLQEKKIPVVDGRPPKATKEEKMDWNAYLKLKKKGQIMEHHLNKRLTQNKEVEPHRKETRTKLPKTAEEHYFDWIEEMRKNVQEHLHLPSPPKLASELETVVEPFLTTDLDRLFARRLSLALDTQRVEQSQILSVYQEIEKLDKQISEKIQEQEEIAISNQKENALKQAQGQEVDRSNGSMGSLQLEAEGSPTPVAENSTTFEQTVTSHPTFSYPLLKFSTSGEKIQRRYKDYHLVDADDMKRLKQYAPSIQATAQWYLNEVADSRIMYVFVENGSEKLLVVDFLKENFIHLTGIRPFEPGKTAEDFLIDFAQGRGHFPNILASHALKEKLQVLPMLEDILDSRSFVLNDLSSVEKLNKLDFSEAIKAKDEDFLLLFKDSEKGIVPASLMKLKGELAANVKEIDEKVILGIYREREGKIEQLSLNDEYIKDGGKQLLSLLQLREQTAFQDQILEGAIPIRQDEQVRKRMEHRGLTPENTAYVYSQVRQNGEVLQHGNLYWKEQAEALVVSFREEGAIAFVSQKILTKKEISQRTEELLAENPDLEWTRPYSSKESFVDVRSVRQKKHDTPDTGLEELEEQDSLFLVNQLDSDGDGISDEEELKQGTNPYDFRSQPTTKNQEEREEQEVEDSSIVVANLIQNQDIAGLNRHLKEGIKEYLDSDKYKDYLTKMSQLNNYSSRNLRLILAQQPAASQVASFKQWKETFGRHVKKGEKALRIFVPITYIKKDENNQPILDKDGKPEIGTTFRLKAAVFDVSQTDGKEMPKAVSDVKDQLTDQDYGNLYRTLMTLAKNNHVSVRFEELEESRKAYYDTANHQIVLNKVGMNKSQLIKTFLHETAHSELHYKDHPQKDQLTRSTAELQAESVAYVVASYYGLDTSSYSFGYLANWSQDKDTLRDLEAQLDIVQQEAKSLIERMDKELEILRLSQTKQYSAWRRQNNFRYELKQRLDFLLKHSTSLEDFKEKAKALEIQIDFSGKFVKYRLLTPLDGKLQERNTRDDTLSKKRLYSPEKIKERVSKNQLTFSTSNIKEMYQHYREEKELDFELKLDVAAWQVEQESPKGIYLQLDMGALDSGTILIPSHKVDKKEDGSYTIYIKEKDYFYFLNPDYSEKNRYMMGVTVGRQLAKQNGEVLITKNPHISSMQELIKEYNFLVEHGVTDGEQFSHLEERFNQKIANVEKELKRLDGRLARYHKIEGALLALEKTSENTLPAMQLLEEMDLPRDISLSDVSQLIQQYNIEKGALQEFFDDTLREYTNYRELQDVISKREHTNRAVSEGKSHRLDEKTL